MSGTRTRHGAPVELPFQVFARQFEKLPPCQSGCPNSGDIRGWLGILAQRQKNGLSFEEACDMAWHRLVEFNPMPATIGRICPHPCEDLCSRGEKDGAVSINAMERFLGDWALTRALALPRAAGERFPESVAIVGSGPASLSFAYQMARRGYTVTMYDKDEQPGGMLRHAIPDYRLPRKILDAEVERILALGIELVSNVHIGDEIPLDEIRDRHSLVFLGFGAQAPKYLGIPGEDGPGVIPGIGYLRRRKHQGPIELGAKVLVIGGGNTAIDAARSARRDGASVTLVYRRGESEMPAASREVDDAREEGIEFRFLAAPTRIMRDGQNVRQVEVQRMRLSEPGADGRRRPEPLPGELEQLPADCVIVAVSQAPGWQISDAGLQTDAWFEPEYDGRLQRGLFAGGDDRGPGIASRAIAQGRHAAESAHAELRGLDRPHGQPDVFPITAESIRTDHYADRPRSPDRRRPRDEWLTDPEAEIDLTLSHRQAAEEAARCMSCGLCFDCRQCYMYCNAGGFSRLHETRPGHYFVMVPDLCEGCGKCIELCPCGFLESRETAG
jgi:formate dehydrogenase major subunit